MAEERLQGIEQRLERAISNRAQHFKDQASSLTMESVRRLLENDLELGKYALDEYKRLVRKYVEKILDITGGNEKDMAEIDREKTCPSIKEETPGVSAKLDSNNDWKKSVSVGEGTTEDSPVMGVLASKSEQGLEVCSLSESKIEKAVWERADYIRANSETITMSGVRRFLEEDLGLQKCMLDPFKKFITQQIDRVLCSSEGSRSTKDSKKNKPDNVNRKNKCDSSDNLDSEIDHKEKKKEKSSKSTPKGFENPNKRKSSEESGLGLSSKKSKKERRKADESESSDSEACLSDDGQSKSNVVKSVQNKEKSAAGYGKRAENLKSIIKACGMSVPPSIYKKVKQVPDSEREAFLVKELQGILSKEGLSNNSTEKEIKDCRKRKQTLRELEGIETSNIITSSRRRSTFSFAPPVQLDAQAKKDEVAKNSKSKGAINKENNDVSEEKDEVKKEGEDEVKEEEKDEIRNGKKGEDEANEVEEEEEEEEDDDEEEDEADESDEFDEDESD